MTEPQFDTSENSIVLFGLTRAHEWQVGALARDGVTTFGWHVGGDSYLPKGAVALNPEEPPEALGPSASVFFLHESHFEIAFDFARAIGASIGDWTITLNDKLLQRSALRQFLPPDFVFSGRSIEAFSDTATPFFIKPRVQSGGSRDVRLFTERWHSEAHQHFQDLADRGLKPMAESKVDGTEYCVDGVVTGGVVEIYTIGRYIFSGVPLSPRAIFFDRVGRAKLMEWAQRCGQILDALDYQHGPFHVEFIDGHSGLFPVEVHGRYGGSTVSEAIHRIRGTSPFVRSAAETESPRPQNLVWLEYFYNEMVDFGQLDSFVFISKPHGSVTLFPKSAGPGEGPIRVGYATVVGRNYERLLANRRLLLGFVEREYGCQLGSDWFE